MLDIKFIRDNSDKVISNTRRKNSDADINALLDLDNQRRQIIQSVEELKSQRNTVSAEVARKKKSGENADELITAMRDVSATIKSEDERLRDIDEEMEQLGLSIPNMLHESVPDGRTSEDNVEIRRSGELLEKGFRKDHLTISQQLGLHDFERGAKITGSGFPVYTGIGARLERALINYFLDFNREQAGFHEMMVPFVVNRASMTGTGQLPKFAEDMYRCDADELYLIPTAEVPLTNYHAGEILPESDLTIRYTTYTPCFRREAGSYGKDTRGFQRLHQFNKVEMVAFTRPEDSYNELESFVSHVEQLLASLNLTYRVILLCAGDTTFGSAKTYDLEVWSPVEQKWLEVSSCSNFEEFQARRAGIKYRPREGGKASFVHTLNGSALATPRIIVSLLETCQREDGSLELPAVLEPYLGFTKIG